MNRERLSGKQEWREMKNFLSLKRSERVSRRLCNSSIVAEHEERQREEDRL